MTFLNVLNVTTTNKTCVIQQIRKSFKAGADAIRFDLEDSVAADRKAAARETVL